MLHSECLNRDSDRASGGYPGRGQGEYHMLAEINLPVSQNGSLEQCQDHDYEDFFHDTI
jgi:hypothetical protein